MIDSDFIIRYTNGLYSTPPDIAPRYDEFRDMFSSGQIHSKEWIINELKKLNINNQHVLIVGSWYGTLGLLINKAFPDAKITLLDIDARCEHFIEKITYDIPNINAVTSDMYEYTYCSDLVINTACEHINSLKDWLKNLPTKTTVVLQSNNYHNGNGHINCVNSINEFKEQTELSQVFYSGELVMPMYTRYMIIGKV